VMKVTSMFELPSKTIHNGTVLQWELLKENDFSSGINVLHANVVNPGVDVEPHQHENDEQIYFILGGVGTVTVGSEKRPVKEGDTVYLPPKLPHSIKNSGSYPLRFLAIGARIR
jgi:mannose-6-phosphate isomerase-like protein (cupin superfamily)